MLCSLCSQLPLQVLDQLLVHRLPVGCLAELLLQLLLLGRGCLHQLLQLADLRLQLARLLPAGLALQGHNQGQHMTTHAPHKSMC